MILHDKGGLATCQNDIWLLATCLLKVGAELVKARRTFAGCETHGHAALQVAQVLVESVLQSGASNKVVEIVAGKQVAASSPDKWFANL